ncbi:uncharacterized protein LOC6728848 [Drosophila simulans]|uniref:uncharacterized protein LOC6728848 n=1 Tax=Drosophila simulans TaxID=7240 RepID=UPI00078AF288|nr:uncharacterized protein LOC6728848 [Drosophila simulans]KMZ04770.1 uncharacterized protein Dsimw501_GD18589, isoform A [Drosophila simulans]KMZ04771.1 uncharacterized protein Dsimw501_GD18589, isoform B [Drosophila simulans]
MNMTLEGSNDFVVLTDVVRKQYVLYLERQLQENVCAWANQSRNRHKPTAWSCIPASLEQLENKAKKASMAAQIYQRAMVKTIAAVRRNTQECRLANILFEQMQQAAGEDAVPIKSDHRLVDKATQTTAIEAQNGHITPTEEYDDDSYELRRKIDMFQASLERSEVRNETHCPHCRSKVITPENRPLANEESLYSETEDAVAQELATLFGEEPTDLNHIFGIEPTAVTDDPQISAILKEIANAELPEKNEHPPTSPTATPPTGHHSEVDLRQSRWPCELYAQRRRLNACLVRLLEADWRCEDRLRYRFHLIFGEDSDDEFANQLSSPSIDLVDEVLLASCLLRIRPWIVRHLMPPLEEGLIANRFLFKKLAKMLAHSIVMVNPYCSELEIKQAVEQLFCLRPRGIQSAYDLDNLPPVEVTTFEV